MGQANSQLSKQNARKNKSGPRRQVLVRKLKTLTKRGMNKRRRKELGSRSSSKRFSTISSLPLPREDNCENVILPTHEAEEKRTGNITGFSKHSLLSYALSKLAIFAKLSRDKLSLTTLHGGVIPSTKFSFHDHKPKPIASKSGSSDKTGSIEATSSVNIKIIKSIPSSNGDGAIELPELDNEVSEVVIDVNNNKSLRDAVVKRLLSSTSSIKAVKTPEELYRKNLEKFETLLAITATTTSEDDTDSVDENNNVLLSGISKRSRIISSSKNRVEVDTYFLDWIKSKISTKKESSSEEEESSSSEDEKGKTSRKSSNKSSKHASAKASKTHTNQSNSKASVKKKDSSSSETGYGSGSYNHNKNPCIKMGPCAGKGFMSGAPPAYLDYGCAQTYPGAACRKGRDPVIDRLKNVDVVEQLTYMVPDPCCEDEEDEDDDCEYYAVCESCGEMEPLPEELQSQLKKKNCKKRESKPVTYSRRQRFNFKNNDDEDDGPPFRYDGTMGKSCRCPCCVAGLRRDPNCGCKCCQVMGNSRRVNSFDEIPVGKNPQIRRILCPMEAYEKKLEHVDRILPEQSGVYQFEQCDVQFERQVPRTPTPIILEVPRPRGLNREEVLDIAKGLTQAQADEDNCCYCNDPYVEVCEPEPEPIYLPPIYGQFNPCCPPCCEPDEMNNNDGSRRGTSGKKQTTTGSYGSKSDQSGSNEGSTPSNENASGGTEESSGSLPSVELE